MEETGAPEIIETYYEDTDRNRIPDNKIRIGQEVNLIIRTRNAIGELVSIDLADNCRDFEFNGELLENDILEDIVIRSNTQQVGLKIVKEQHEE
ncbi:hypothetical protein H0I23_00805 [Cellulophaga sp. HaHaR_3_176]|uniref:hypothetical protein n=1 Tax=Cellulophaga sp. HaHaR_3_176 TaxID=1942464 RepID=UPI001C1F3200|nr:hypothetical protein [Cellulophaga sp. HaHaR_3_176]QWX84222.1 hypothetical protein H0I23_00805 [Cellulophaga sp. HaHaR_3_176]